MTVPPEELELAAAFPPAERDRWREMVKGVLRKSGAATEETPLDEIEGLLTRESYDGVPIAALYTRDDAPPGRPGLAPYVREVRPEASTTRSASSRRGLPGRSTLDTTRPVTRRPSSLNIRSRTELRS